MHLSSVNLVASDKFRPAGWLTTGMSGQVHRGIKDPGSFPSKLPVELRRLGETEAQRPEEEEEPCEGARATAPSVPPATAPPAAAAPPAATGGQPGKALDPPPDLSVTEHCPSEVEETWREWQLTGKESKILGQAYKPKVKYLKQLEDRDLPTVGRSRGVMRVSKFLHCSPLLPVPVVSMPDIIKKQLATQENRGKQKCRKKPRPKQQPKKKERA
ncbi:hypothetical protein GJAV_G00035080 [Gymnothorax javanicus]|nr:hypothetical protein GJAV_G00035080 [Gymnothorax javanicus]